MGMPIATKKSGNIAFAFPDVCKTPSPPGAPIPIPYPNIGQLSDATDASDSSNGNVKVKGEYVILANKSEIPQTSGDEAGSVGGVKSSKTKGKVEFKRGSATVKIHGQMVVRLMDTTLQNDGNAVGMVLGGEPTVMVGG